MKYKIIVDKQSRTNPSNEKKEYEIDIEELRAKGDVYDSLVITKDEDYVIRRLKLTEFYVLEELEEPIKETLENINIELFEGDNYIYLIDMIGNKFYAEYLIKNEFNDIYVTLNQMHSAINQSAGEVEIAVNQKLTKYSTTEEMNAAITTKADEINLEVSKKVNDSELTGANISLRINNDTSEAKIKADKININGAISANGNFKIDTQGNMECNNGKFNGGEVILTDDGFSAYEGKLRVVGEDFINGLYSKGLVIRKPNSPTNTISKNSIFLHMYNGTPTFTLSGNNHNFLTVDKNSFQFMADDNDNVAFYVDGGIKNAGLQGINQFYVDGGITTPTVTQTSLETEKKNFEKLTLEEAKKILEKTDIYKYNLKTQDDSKKKHIGFVIGKNFNYAEEITSENDDGVDNYSMTSVLYTIVKEQQKAIDNLLKRVEALEAKK